MSLTVQTVYVRAEEIGISIVKTTQMPNKGMNQIGISEMFGPNMADKYAWAPTKNLGLMRNYSPCTSDNFLIMHPSFVVKTYHYIDIYCTFLMPA